MYMSFLYEVPEEYYRSHSVMFNENIYLSDKRELRNIKEFVKKFGMNEYKHLFDIIGIKYSRICEYGTAYELAGGTVLFLSELSTGERIMLYSMVMSKLNKPIVVIGLTERLDKKHRDILLTSDSLFKTLIVFVMERRMINRDILDKFYKPFKELLEEGIL